MTRHREQEIELENGIKATVNDIAIHLADADGWFITMDHDGKVKFGGKGRDLDELRALAKNALSKSFWAKKEPKPLPALVPSHRRPTRARKTKCPNPRNCGDPTCDGLCGYPEVDADGRWVD